jgi:hypothetical protein
MATRYAYSATMDVQANISNNYIWLIICVGDVKLFDSWRREDTRIKER